MMTRVKPSENRSAIMRAVRSRDTKPEKIVRSFLHGQGYRFRLCGDDLPGKPDIVMRRWQVAVFVHGCFWHGHSCKRGNRVPISNRKYWLAKIARNKARDAENITQLKRLGWRVFIVWECQTNQMQTMSNALDDMRAGKP